MEKPIRDVPIKIYLSPEDLIASVAQRYARVVMMNDQKVARLARTDPEEFMITLERQLEAEEMLGRAPGETDDYQAPRPNDANLQNQPLP